MQTVKIFRVYGAEGHRQRESFYRSYVSDISRPNSPRSIEVRNSDKTGTNDFSILQIVGESDIDCYTELQLQLSTGAFECSKVGDVYEILADGLAVKMGATDRGFLPVGTPESLPVPTPSKLKKPHNRALCFGLSQLLKIQKEARQAHSLPFFFAYFQTFSRKFLICATCIF